MVKEFLSQRGVTYTLKDVSRDPEAASEFLATGALLPPVVVVDGELVAGYDPVRLEEVLQDHDEDADMWED